MTDAQRRTLMFLGGIIATLVVVIVVLLVTGGDDAATTTTAIAADTSTSTSLDGATTTVAPETTTTVAETTTAPSTTAGATTTTGVAGACAGLPSLAVPPDATGPQADFDGDGALDTLVGFQDPDGVWWVAIRLSYGYAQGTAVPGFAEARSVFSFDGFPVGFARVDGGASTELIGGVYWLGCNLYEATVDSGAVARFPLGGSVTHIDGMRCAGDRLTATGWETADAVTFEYRETDYLWVPGLGEFQVFLSSIQMLTSPADDATIFAAGDYAC